MAVLLTSFASRSFYKNQQRLSDSAKQIGITNVFLFKYISLLRYPVFWKHLRVFRSRRGAGYWAWHATVIREALSRVQEDDLVIFCDAGLRFINTIDFIEPLMSGKHVLFFSTGGFSNRQYTKRDTFILMGCDEPVYWDGPQVMGGFHVWKKCSDTYRLLNEYEQYCLNYQIVSDAPSKLAPDLPEFIDHRHPQSVMSLLVIKYGYEIMPYPVCYPGDDDAGEGKLPRRFLAPNRASDFSRINLILNKIALWF